MAKFFLPAVTLNVNGLKFHSKGKRLEKYAFRKTTM